ncbi:PIG-L deacetylase family protein [Vibrio splendidus]|uniref:PIG-L deacetylase family protein n=1 Tax=Vibrio splendidus TaxID=29497 RepID=UPI000C862ED1|nr:PIG-L family deacetylase [Vibrio splendidus]PMI73728.1 hypothetical protein BCU38_17095 [Vibrio splendidus]
MVVIKELIFEIIYLIFKVKISRKLSCISLNGELNELGLNSEFCDKSIIISPHSDDETLGCFKLIRNSTVNTKCLLVSGRKDRLLELLSVIKFLESNIEVIALGYTDGSISSEEDDIYNSIVNNLKILNVNNIFSPSLFDFHPDHRAVAKISLRLLKDGVVKNVYFYHTNHPLNFKFLNCVVNLDLEESKLKMSSLRMFKTQRLLNFKGICKISFLYSKCLIKGSNYNSELYLKVDLNNLIEVENEYYNYEEEIVENEFSRSVVHPLNFYKNIFYWNNK